VVAALQRCQNDVASARRVLRTDFLQMLVPYLGEDWTDDDTAETIARECARGALTLHSLWDAALVSLAVTCHISAAAAVDNRATHTPLWCCHFRATHVCVDGLVGAQTTAAAAVACRP
jgi:hypothetical protein